MVKVTDKSGAVHTFPLSNIFLPGAGGFVIVGSGESTDGAATFTRIDAAFAGDAVLKVETVAAANDEPAQVAAA